MNKLIEKLKTSKVFESIDVHYMIWLKVISYDQIVSNL